MWGGPGLARRLGPPPQWQGCEVDSCPADGVPLANQTWDFWSGTWERGGKARPPARHAAPHARQERRTRQGKRTPPAAQPPPLWSLPQEARKTHGQKTEKPTLPWTGQDCPDWIDPSLLLVPGSSSSSTLSCAAAAACCSLSPVPGHLQQHPVPLTRTGCLSTCSRAFPIIHSSIAID